LVYFNSTRGELSLPRSTLFEYGKYCKILIAYTDVRTTTALVWIFKDGDEIYKNFITANSASRFDESPYLVNLGADFPPGVTDITDPLARRGFIGHMNFFMMKKGFNPGYGTSYNS